jgi:hypothetical protein
VQNTQLYILNQIVRVNSSLIFPIAAAFKKRSLLVLLGPRWPGIRLRISWEK